MATLPLDVYEVLEQEYESRYGAPPRSKSHSVDYDDAQILDERFARSILATCRLDDPNHTARYILNEMIATGKGIANLVDSPVLDDNGLTMVKNADEYATGAADPRAVRRRILDVAFAGAVQSLRDIRLATFYSELHAKSDDDARAAVCISGGGIRSATFALGVLQGLAGAKILDKFEYLSTVSGGGYIGSWLSSWARRHPRGMSGVQDDLVRGDSAVDAFILPDGQEVPKSDVPKTKVEPEAQPVRHLREYSNYLAPRLGFTSADTWTIAALYLRNLMLNLLVLVPVLAAFLAFPRAFAWLLRESNLLIKPWGLLTSAVVLVGLGFAYLGSTRPVEHGRQAERKAILPRLKANGRFVVGCVLPLTLASIALALFWAQAAYDTHLLQEPWFKPHIVALFAVMLFAPFFRYYWRVTKAAATDRHDAVAKDASHALWKKIGIEFFASVTGIVTNAVLLLLLTDVFADPQKRLTDPSRITPILRPLFDGTPASTYYLCFAVPALLLVFFVQASVFVGLSSRYNEDYDREWWGRAGAWLLMFAAGLAFFSLISIFGPVVLYHAPFMIASAGGFSGLLAAMIGFSAKSSATSKDDKSKTGTLASSLSNALLVPIFVIIFLAAISLCTTTLLQQFTSPDPAPPDAFSEEFKSSATEVVKTKIDRRTFSISTAAPTVALVSPAMTHSIAHLNTIQGTEWWELALIADIALLAYLLSHAIGVNRFSMHAFYRNRLVRAYLGASRYNRDPDRFTGFDANDNVQMYELRQDILWPSHFTDASQFLTDFANKAKAKDPVATKLWDRLDDVTRKRLEAGVRDGRVVDSVTQHINAAIVDGSVTRAQVETISAMVPKPNRGPMHVVNACLNLTVGQNLAWQQRQAESFTASPLHCGSLFTGYRDARYYGGDDGISLGNAVTISGAAANPNQGYNSRPAVAFLLTLLNVRLGSWLGNPGVAGGDTFNKANPSSNLKAMFGELLGLTNDTFPWINLSDGGHFENLALYEMIVRRCRFIVLSDGGCDPKFSFDDLGNAIRKIRIDLGVPIEIKEIDMLPRSEPGQPLVSGTYMARAAIRYSAIDTNATDGTLIYIKPSVYKGDYLPRDVYNYAQESGTFPHETTADQFFSESQFESYRALGRYVVNVICGNYDAAASRPSGAAAARTYASVAEFFDNVPPKPPAFGTARMPIKGPQPPSSGTGGPEVSVPPATPPA